MGGYNYTYINSFDAYKSLGVKSRNIEFLIDWLYDIYKIAYLPSTEDKYRNRLAVDKVKLSIFNILLDDLADNAYMRDDKLLETALRIPWNNSQMNGNKYLNVAKKIWIDTINSISNYPFYKEYKEIFFFDLDQFLDAIKYSYLVNTTDLDNDLETELYSHHNMMVIVFCDMDLMCNSSFNKDELRKLRPILHLVQEITHVGNVLATYPREIIEKDFSSPIISYGIREGIISKDIVYNEPESALQELDYLVPILKMKVESNFEKIEILQKEIDSINIDDFIKRVRKIWTSFIERANNWEETELYKEKLKETKILEPLTIYKKNTSKWIRM